MKITDLITGESFTNRIDYVDWIDKQGFTGQRRFQEYTLGEIAGAMALKVSTGTVDCDGIKQMAAELRKKAKDLRDGKSETD